MSAMAGFAPPSLHALPPPASGTAPCRWQWLGDALADLGVVLYVYTPHYERSWLAPQAPWPARRELLGLVAAERVVASVAVDSDGPHECLRFVDDAGDTRASLWLLPDSDFLAWETLLAALPGDAIARDRPRRPEAPTRRSQARVLTLQRARVGGVDLLDARVPSRVSVLGLASAHRLALAEHATLEPLPHDCCCQRAASTT